MTVGDEQRFGNELTGSIPNHQNGGCEITIQPRNGAYIISEWLNRHAQLLGR